MIALEDRTIGNCRLILGDMRDVMPHLPPIQCVVTDPPYPLTSGGNVEHETSMKGIFSHDQYDNKGKIVACDIEWNEFCPLIFNAMDAGHCYMFSNDKNLPDMFDATRAAKFRFHNMLYWRKNTQTPNRFYMKNTEYVGFFFKGKARKILDCGAVQGIYCPADKVTNHPTEKPVSLMRHYIKNSARPDDLVCDPFMGAGASAVAAVREQRRFIGIEIEKEWYDVTCERVAEAVEGKGLTMDMFSEGGAAHG